MEIFRTEHSETTPIDRESDRQIETSSVNPETFFIFIGRGSK